jgi:3-oxoacyl-[acyl-carrier-protein] synthase III
MPAAAGAYINRMAAAAAAAATPAGMEAARFEFAATCFSCVEELLQKTGVKASQINFVITNSSLFNPTPSLSTSIMNHFKMGGNTRGYSLVRTTCYCVCYLACYIATL